MADRNDKKIQCHFISNTHWDREWRFSARRTQYMLGYMLDMLMDILEKNPEFRHFHLDSQTMPVQDYLELYPEKKARFKKLVEEGGKAFAFQFIHILLFHTVRNPKFHDFAVENAPLFPKVVQLGFQLLLPGNFLPQPE